ncbi:MAG: hypothetical protein SGI77_23560 [Pirellulaceae bacterium]|nr:hypothetical protein [Pirellulaceae bacterium]
MKSKPPESGLLEAKGKNGQRIFYQYSCDQQIEDYDEKTMWCFQIANDDGVFDFHLVDEDSLMRVEMMTRNDCELFKARGIAEAFIRLSSQIFKIDICSSSRARPQPSTSRIESVAEQHSDGARKVWQGLVDSKESHYDNCTQRFVYPYKNREEVDGDGR